MGWNFKEAQYEVVEAYGGWKHTEGGNRDRWPARNTETLSEHPGINLEELKSSGTESSQEYQRQQEELL